MNVLFLDIDGVLNSHEYMLRIPTPPGMRTDEDCFDPLAVERLSRIVEESGAGIVISSSWRIGSTVPRIDALLRSRGLRCGRLVGATPILMRQDRAIDRGIEIAAWLHAAGPVDGYVILDDDSDAGVGHDGHFIHTDWGQGLLDEHIPVALSMLGVP